MSVVSFCFNAIFLSIVFHSKSFIIQLSFPNVSIRKPVSFTSILYMAHVNSKIFVQVLIKVNGKIELSKPNLWSSTTSAGLLDLHLFLS